MGVNMIEGFMQVINDFTYDLFSVQFLLIILALGVILLIPKVGVFVLKIVAQAGIGSLVILGINWIFSGLDIFVGLNIITVSVAGLLGIPGVASLYILSALIKV